MKKEGLEKESGRKEGRLKWWREGAFVGGRGREPLWEGRKGAWVGGRDGWKEGVARG